MKHLEENCGSWSEWSQTLLILTGTDYWCETESFTSLKIYWGNVDFSVFLNVSVVERSHAVFGELIFLVCRMKMKLVTFWIKITECFFLILNSFFLWSSKTEKQIKIWLKERLKKLRPYQTCISINCFKGLAREPEQIKPDYILRKDSNRSLTESNHMVTAFWGKLPQKGWIQHKLTLNPTLINKQRDNKQWGHFSLILYYKFRLCLFLACCDVLSVSINAEMCFRKNAEQKQIKINNKKEQSRRC